MATHTHDDPTRTTAIGMCRYAYEFLEGGFILDDSIGQRPGFQVMAPIPALYLVGHGIELVLKAYLIHKGIPLGELRKKYGHDLHASFRKSKELGLVGLVTLNVPEDGAFELLNELYSTKQLEYIVTGAKRVPLFGLLESAAAKLFNAVSTEVGFGKQFEAYHGS